MEVGIIKIEWKVDQIVRCRISDGDDMLIIARVERRKLKYVLLI
jgi:hypothetical protein